MTLFKKKIVTPRVYRASTSSKGGKEAVAMTPERIKSMHDTGNAMIAAGLKISAPFAHRDEKGIVPKPLLEGQLGNWNSSINGGYWKGFEIDPEDKGLVGILETPGDVEDFSSPSGKVGKTIQETSVFLLPDWTDGNGKEWKDALWHVALVDGKAVESGQKNFEKVDEPQLSLAMSFSMADAIDVTDVSDNDSTPNQDSGGALVTQIIEKLQEKLELELPSDTNDGNFLDRLLTVLTAFKSETEEEDLTQKPKGAETQSSPIAMSESTQSFEVIEKKTKSVLQALTQNKKDQLKTRLGTLLSKGVIGKKDSDNWLSKIDSIAMSMDDISDEGDFPEIAIEMAIEMLEENGVA